MADYTVELQELEQGMFDVLLYHAHNPAPGSDSGQVYAHVLRTIQAAKQTQSADDVHRAYTAFLQVSKSADDLQRRRINTFLDLLGWGALSLIPAEHLPTDLRRTLALLPPEWDSPFMQHFIQFWHLESCHDASIYDNDFWDSWQRAYELAIRYRAGLASEYIRYLFAVHNERIV